MFVNLHNNALNFYSIFGEKGLNRDMSVPAAFQVAAPFGHTVGGTNPLFWEIMPEAQWDSWLTVAVADGNPNNAISSIGIPWDDWTEHAAIRVDDGAIFWMDPDQAPHGRQLVAQFTVTAAVLATKPHFRFSLQGRTVGGGSGDGNWKAYGLRAYLGERPTGAPEPEPEPEAVVDCVGEWTPYGDCDRCYPLGRKRRNFHVITPASEGGRDCAKKDGDSESIKCQHSDVCPQACSGRWSDCSAACEVAAERSWSETKPQILTGTPCPAAKDCTDGEGMCIKGHDALPPPPPHSYPPVSRQVLRCNESPQGQTSLTSESSAKAIFDFHLDAPKHVTILPDVLRNCPTLSLFSGSVLDGAGGAAMASCPNCGSCAEGQPTKVEPQELAAGDYTVLVESPEGPTEMGGRATPTAFRLTVLCSSPRAVGPLPGPDGGARAGAGPAKGDGAGDGGTPGWEVALVVALVVGCALLALLRLCLMKRQVPHDSAKAMLEAHLDSGLDRCARPAAPRAARRRPCSLTAWVALCSATLGSSASPRPASSPRGRAGADRYRHCRAAAAPGCKASEKGRAAGRGTV